MWITLSHYNLKLIIAKVDIWTGDASLLNVIGICIHILKKTGHKEGRWRRFTFTSLSIETLVFCFFTSNYNTNPINAMPPFHMVYVGWNQHQFGIRISFGHLVCDDSSSSNPLIVWEHPIALRSHSARDNFISLLFNNMPVGQVTPPHLVKCACTKQPAHHMHTHTHRIHTHCTQMHARSRRHTPHTGADVARQRQDRDNSPAVYTPSQLRHWALLKS